MKTYDNDIDKHCRRIIVTLESNSIFTVHTTKLRYDFCCSCRRYIDEGEERVDIDWSGNGYLTACIDCFIKAIFTSEEYAKKYFWVVKKHFIRQEKQKTKDMLKDFKKRISRATIQK